MTQKDLSPRAPQKVWVAPTPVAASADDTMRVNVEWTVPLGTDTHSCFFRTLEGTVGLFWATYDDLPSEGSRIRVAMKLPGDITLTRNGTVSWRRERVDTDWPGYGILFDEVDAELAKCIASFERVRPSLYVPEALL